MPRLIKVRQVLPVTLALLFVFSMVTPLAAHPLDAPPAYQRSSPGSQRCGFELDTDDEDTEAAEEESAVLERMQTRNGHILLLYRLWRREPHART